MPAARDALLNAALAALNRLPWSAVRMVDVASAAGVSRQTLYNEFGSKEGLARALVRREADAYLRGVERILADRPPVPDLLAFVAEWIVTEAADRPLLRALLTGSWNERLPAPRPARAGAHASAVPAQRRADA
ncbi:helix-turn-helix domain-containing protein, partial [Streptomyces sp.]|uniref:TetR/AcrR family transcriptional regulator n=1 Tax=Streptomyces sp. TaxID=1931 RepID=UPI002F95ECE4